jgi:hypothetical protein
MAPRRRNPSRRPACKIARGATRRRPCYFNGHAVECALFG